MSNPVNRSIMSKIIVGVTAGALGLGGLLYFYYTQNKTKDDSSSSSSADAAAAAIGKKKKRLSVGGNRVTFAEENEIFGTSSIVEKDYDNEDPVVNVSPNSSPMESTLKNELFSSSTSAPLSSSSPLKSSLIKSKSSPEATNNVTQDDSSNQNDSPVSEIKTETTTKSSPVVKTESQTKSAPESMRSDKNIEEGDKALTANSESSGIVEETVERNINAESASIPSSVPVAISNGNSSGLQQEAIVTPETDYDRTSMTREMRIMRDHVPGLIGRKGVNIRQIQQNSNTSICFRDETLENGDRVCVIRGQPHDVTVAESLIEKFIMEQPIITTQTLYIPQSSVGRIIGKGGESIRGIQDFSKAKVNVDTTSQHKGGGDGHSVKTVQVTIRGSEEQIETARQMIIEKVEEEKALRRNIDIVTQNRTQRRAGSSSSSPGSTSGATVNGNAQAQMLPLINNAGVFEVFVSCAYHPNDFWIQVKGRESIELDKLTEAMTEWYSQQPPEEEFNLSTLDIIAAPFDVDGKMYRGKILKLEDDEAEVVYVDYGDKRVIKQTEIRRLHPEFLKLRFQAIQATLNIGCIGDRWPDAAIVTFCDLSYCAQWQSLWAKVKDYLKDPVDQKDIIWVELLDQNVSIGNELIARGLAIPSDSLPVVASSSDSLQSRKSYASVVSEETKVTEFPDGNREDEIWDDNRNGN